MTWPKWWQMWRMGFRHEIQGKRAERRAFLKAITKRQRQVRV